jgi:predicted anti-sigma-YlaC factor YlaD
MMCDPEKIQAYLENELSAHEAARVQAHLHECRACGKLLEQCRTLFRELDQLGEPDLPVSFDRQIISRVYEDLTITFHDRSEKRRAIMGGVFLGASSVVLLSLSSVVNFIAEGLSGVRVVAAILWNVAQHVLQGFSWITTGLLHQVATDINVSPIPAALIASVLGVTLLGLLNRLAVPVSRQ